jgi:hypothetical protein
LAIAWNLVIKLNCRIHTAIGINLDISESYGPEAQRHLFRKKIIIYGTAGFDNRDRDSRQVNF